MIGSPKLEDVALNPAWRKAGVHLIVKASWAQDLPDAKIQQIQDRMTNNVGYAMRQLSPDSGCYVNEASDMN